MSELQSVWKNVEPKAQVSGWRDELYLLLLLFPTYLGNDRMSSFDDLEGGCLPWSSQILINASYWHAKIIFLDTKNSWKASSQSTDTACWGYWSRRECVWFWSCLEDASYGKSKFTKERTSCKRSTLTDGTREPIFICFKQRGNYYGWRPIYSGNWKQWERTNKYAFNSR